MIEFVFVYLCICVFVYLCICVFCICVFVFVYLYLYLYRFALLVDLAPGGDSVIMGVRGQPNSAATVSIYIPREGKESSLSLHKTRT